MNLRNLRVREYNRYAATSMALSRRVFPSLFAQKIVGVQPMAAPTGLAFAMRTVYNGKSGS